MDEAAFLERPSIEVAYGNPKKPTLLRITPLRVRQIPAFQKYFNLAICALAKRQAAEPGTNIEMDLAELIAEDRENLIKAVAAATDTTVEFISGGVLLSQFLPLVEAVFELNRDFIFAKGEPPKPGKPRNDEKWGWADCLQHLISGGHRLNEIKEYTFAELKAYSEAVSRSQRLAAASELLNMRVAQYEPEDFKRHFEELVHG